MSVTRRQLLIGAGGLLVVGGLGAGAVETHLWRHVRDAVDPAPEPSVRIPNAPTGAVVSGSFPSQARRTTVGWSVAYPPGSTEHATLPVAIVLHGKGNDHKAAFGGHHLDRFLAAAVQSGVPPFALASVDGGDDSYWHRRKDGTDAMAMLTDEFVPLLAQRGLRTKKIGLLGWSMGGYGALHLAEQLGTNGCAAVAVDSPALWLHAGDTAPGAFDDAADYHRNDVFAARARLTNLPVRIACGTSDPFYAATRAFVAGLPQRPELDLSIGGHTIEFWQHSAPNQLEFLGRHLASG